MKHATGKWFVAALVLGVALFVHPAIAQDDYDYEVDRVRVVVDSVVVLDDNFGDGALGPWVEVLQTVEDNVDGYLHLMSPGVVVPFRGLDNERTDARWTGSLPSADDWTIESFWEIDPLSDDLSLGRSFAMNIVASNDILVIGILNYTPEDAALLQISPSGLVAFVGHTTTGLDDIAFTGTTITAASFTGQVVKEISHVGGSSTVELRVSLDGGTNYIDFGSFSITESTYQLNLFADPLDVALPSGHVCYKVKDLKNPKFVKVDDIPFANALQSGFLDTKRPFLVCPPTSISGGDITDPTNWLCQYKIKADKLVPRPALEVSGLTGGTVQTELSKPLLLVEPCPDPLILP